MHNETNLDLHPIASESNVAETVPVIDLDGLVRNGSIDASHPAVGQVADAARRWGFFQVVNHGVAASVVDNIWCETRRWFDRPQPEKESLRRTRENPWGYYNNELTKNQRDKKEVFDFTNDGIDPIYASANRWPDGDDTFRQAMLDYLQTCEQLSLYLLQAFCAGLGLQPTYLDKEFSPVHSGFVRLNHYPVRDPMLGSGKAYQANADLGIHHHTDAGALTVLLQDAVSGLQVHHEGEWHNVPVIDDAFVINTGDMMQVWSNDQYQAAMHRVLAMKTTERYSIPFFYNPSANTRVAPLPSMIGSDRPPQYSQIKWAEYRAKRTDGDYANYGGEVQISQYRTEDNGP